MKVDPGFRELYEREFATVFRTTLLVCGDRQVAEDATQEAFSRALARWRRLRHHPSPGGWVTTTALNAARRSLRRTPKLRADEGAASEGDTADRVALVSAIRDLPARQQEAVALHYLLDLPVAETATAMGVDAGTVKTHLSRAREALNRALRDPDNDDVRS
jgi:RNA polymerase sigma-70 factor, ECF subfamily